MKDIGKLMEEIKAVDVGGYALRLSEAFSLYDAAGRGLEAALAFYKYGFLRGQKAERARAKKEARV